MGPIVVPQRESFRTMNSCNKQEGRGHLTGWLALELLREHPFGLEASECEAGYGSLNLVSGTQVLGAGLWAPVSPT